MNKRNSKYERLKRRRTQLFKQNPFCPECDVKMVLPEEVGYVIERNGGRKNLKENPDNLCVLTRKYKKFESERQDNLTKEIRWTICCHKCNHKNSIEVENKILTIEEKRKRSGSIPLKDIKWDNIEYNNVNSALLNRIAKGEINNKFSFGRFAYEISEEAQVDFMITKAILLQHNDIKVEDGKVLVKEK